jgi:hypothetical protein
MPPPSSAIKACRDSYTPRTTPQSAMLAGTTAANASGSSPTSTSAPTPYINAAEFELPPSVKAFIQEESARKLEQAWEQRIREKAFAIKQVEQEIIEKQQEEEEARKKALAVEAAIAEAEALLSEASRYSDPETLWQALETGDTQLIRMTWLIKHAQAGGVLPRRQELPEEALISRKELKLIFGMGNDAGVLPIVAISATAQGAGHPDSEGAALRCVAKALEREKPKFYVRGGGTLFTRRPEFAEMGVYWPWASVDQRDSSLFSEWMLLPPEDLSEEQKGLVAAYMDSWTEEEQERRTRALGSSGIWYAHECTTVLMLTSPAHAGGSAEAADGEDGGGARTGKRYAVTNTAVKAKLKKSILVRWKDPLVRKVFYAWRRCTNAAAVEKAEAAEAAAAVAAAQARAYGSDGWTTFERCASTQLKRFDMGEDGDGGALPWKLVLDIDSPKGSGFAGPEKHDPWMASHSWPIGPEDFDALVRGQDFPTPSDRELVLALFRRMRVRQLGGAKRLKFARMPPPSEQDAERLGRCLNTCLNCEKIGLADVAMSDAACVKVFSALGHGSLEKLTKLTLFNNAIADAGCKALARAAANGAMKRLAFLSLSTNLINDVGVLALAAALRDGALPELETLCIGYNAFSDAAREVICQTCKERNIICKKDRFGEALLEDRVGTERGTGR